MSITVKFPNNEDVILEQGKPVVILGANGSGKTRLSVKIEELNDGRVNNWNVSDDSMLIHRISAQKSLTIPDTIALMDYKSSRRSLYYGAAYDQSSKIGYRYSSRPVTHLLDDFNAVLALLFAEEYKELQKAHDAMNNIAIKTVREKATSIWNELLPLRKIDLTESNVYVHSNENKYHGKEMSDGERVMLYMICQTLLLPHNSIIIIDEPELHIHKAVVKKLWDKLEEARPECVFMYITHDLDFAASRNTDKILWVKKYHGENSWDYDFLNLTNYEDLPKELLYEILGTRKKILFVEGSRNSNDYVLYNEFFKDKGYHIIPCGGCSEVIKTYKATKNYQALNNIETYCLIDRDFRKDDEISALKKEGVAFLEVAEVENLFVIPELLDIIGKQLGCESDSSTKAKEFIKYLFNEIKPGQIREAFISEINHQFTIQKIENKKVTPEEVTNWIAGTFPVDKIQSYFDESQQLFNAAIEIDTILKVFNFKGLSKKIGTKFNLKDGNDYSQRVITLMKDNPKGIRTEILNALKPYIPELP